MAEKGIKVEELILYYDLISILSFLDHKYYMVCFSFKNVQRAVLEIPPSPTPLTSKFEDAEYESEEEVE